MYHLGIERMMMMIAHLAKIHTRCQFPQSWPQNSNMEVSFYTYVYFIF